MDPFFIFIFLAFFAGLIFVGIYFSRKSVVRRALKKAGEKRIGEFMDGDTGKIVGRVVFAGRTLTAPLSMRSCVYYHIVVEEYRSSGKSGSWHTIIEDEQKGDIVISDGSHYAVIDPQQIKSFLVPDVNYSSGTFNDATPHLEQFLSHYGRKSTGLFGLNKSLRYREGILEKDETFAVSGQGQWIAPQSRGLNISARRVLMITPGQEGHVYLSDDPAMTR